MNNIILSTYIASKKDPQRGTFLKPDNFKYIKIWYDSVVSLGMEAIIFVDGVSDEFIEKYTKNNIRFIRFNADDVPYDINTARFFAYFDFLKNHEFDYVLTTDIADVYFRKNPFEFINGNKLYLQGEKRIARKNKACKRVFPKMYTKYPYWKSRVVNPGILGGSYSTLMRFLELFISQYNGKEGCCVPSLDLPTTNFIANKFFKGNLVFGFPLHSRWKTHNRKKEDVYIVHK